MKKSKRLILIGASGHGEICAEIAKLSGRYVDIFFLDDSPIVKSCGEYKVVGISSEFYQYVNEKTEFFVSIGNYVHRKRIQEKVEIAGGVVTTLIHPKAIVSEKVSIGSGTAVMPGVVINPGTKIGKGCIVNTSSSIDHDCKVGYYTHIAVGVRVCGTVTIGNECWIGAGAVVSNNLNICDAAVIGAGAVVVKDIDRSGTYVGVPAKEKEDKM